MDTSYPTRRGFLATALGAMAAHGAPASSAMDFASALEDATPIEFARLMADVMGGFEAPPGYI